MIYLGLVSEISMEGKAEYHVIQEAEQEGQEGAYDRTLLGTERDNRTLMEGHPILMCYSESVLHYSVSPVCFPFVLWY